MFPFARSSERVTRRLDQLPETQARRVRLTHGSLTYRDRRLEGFDAAALVEVIEHLDPPRLRARANCIRVRPPNDRCADDAQP